MMFNFLTRRLFAPWSFARHQTPTFSKLRTQDLQINIPGSIFPKKKISLWIFTRNSNRVIRFRLARWQLGLGGAAVIFSLYIFSSSILEIFFSDPLDDLSRQLRGKGLHLSALERSEKSVSAKVEELADLIAKVKSYEDELRLKANALDSAINETKSLDFGVSKNIGFSSFFRPKSSSRKDMGGSEDYHIPFYRSLRSSSDTVPSAPTTKPILSRAHQNSGLSRDVSRLLESETLRVRSIPMGLPVFGDITSGFGMRVSPTSGNRHMHEGLDISVSRESPVVSPADGKIVFAGFKGAFGRTIIIDHGSGITTLYAHLSRIDVITSDKVCRGQQLGLVGTTGNSTGPHLHYEVHKHGTPTNPQPYVELASFLHLLS